MFHNSAMARWRRQSWEGRNASQGAWIKEEAPRAKRKREAAPKGEEAVLTRAPSAPASLESLDPLRLLALLPIRPYHVMADLRCGTGHFAITLAKHLFDGKLYAVDTSAEALETLKKRLTEARLGNVEVVQAEPGVIPTFKERLDAAFIGLTLHREQNKVGFLRQVAEALSKGAWTAVIEWQKKETADGPPVEERIGEEELVEAARQAGFRFSERRDLSAQHYLVVLRR